ncbi:MAG TPA: SOS response-associated peptidase [Thermodesulfobacteriaceae bacterium]|nr:SOS response-associated peptidase [Thermodesulfobacteriaceae bacterium]
MCGRYSFWKSCKRLKEEFSLSVPSEFLPEIHPRYNIAPGTDIPAIRQLPEKRRELALLQWGLIPSWAKDKKTGYRLINARAESVATKPAFRSAFRYRRCLIPASGFYEWQKLEGGKQPWFITLEDADLFAFAGLWECWEGQEGEVVESCTIITTDSNDLVRPLHDRMPVIIERLRYGDWLSRESGPDALKTLLCPLPAEKMKARPVSLLVNNPGNESPECCKPMR